MFKYNFLFTLFLLFSCSNRNSSVSFIDTEEMAMEEVSIQNLLALPSNMFCINDNLVITQRKSDKLFWFFDLNTLDFKFSAGDIGRASNEFTLLSPLFSYNTDSGFMVLDSPGILKEVEVKDDKINTKIIKKLSSTHIMNNFLFIDDSTFCFNNLEIKNDIGQFGIAKDNGDKINYFSPYPDWVNVDEQMKIFTYMTNTCINQEKGLIAAFYVYFNRIKIFNTQGKLVNDIKIDLYDDIPIYDASNPYLTFSRPVSIGDYIYVLFQNRKMKDSENLKTEIHVYDWNGNPVKRMFFNRSFNMFTITEDGKFLIAINNKNCNKIYRCELNI